MLGALWRMQEKCKAKSFRLASERRHAEHHRKYPLFLPSFRTHDWALIVWPVTNPLGRKAFDSTMLEL